MLAKLFRASGDRIWEENSVASDSQTNEVWTWDARAVTRVTNYVTCHDKWQDCSWLVTRVSAARHQMTHYWDDTRYPVITSCLLMQPWHLVTTGSGGCWRINSLLQRFYEHHSLRFQLNCVLFFRELIESLSPLWGFIMRHEQGFVGWFLWQTPGWDVSLCHDCMWWVLSGGGCSYLDSINQNLASWLLSIQIPDQSNGQIIIAKKV